MMECPGGGYAHEMWLSEDYAAGLQGEVERELAAELESARARGRSTVTVEVHEGIATLTGSVHGWAEKAAARGAVMRVPGVRGVDDGGVAVSPAAGEARSDAQLVRMVRSALSWDCRVPAATVRASVMAGRVTLSGAVGHEDQRAAAVETVTRLVGVREVTNEIVVPPWPRPPHALTRIEEALTSALGREARHVRVALRENGVELTGRVSTLALRREAERAVRRVLGDVPLSLELH